MFRRPMRLEKWIAFDGALGVEVLNPEPDVTPDNGPDAADPQAYGIVLGSETSNTASQDTGNGGAPVLTASPMSVDIGWTVESGGNTCVVTVELPEDAPAILLPFMDETVTFSTGAGGNAYAMGTDFYLEITGPDGGSFGFVSWEDVQGNQAQFISDNGLSNGDKVAFAFVEDGKNYVTVYTVSGNHFNPSGSGGNGGGRAEFVTLADGGIRLHLVNKGDFTYGNGAYQQILKSLAFFPDSGSSPATVSGFNINVYYQENAGNSSEDLFHDGPGGMYNPTNEDVGVTSTDPDFRHINGPNGLGDDDPEPEPEPAPEPDPDPATPETPLDPIGPPVIPGESQAGDGDGEGEGEGEGEADGGDGSEAEASAEAGTEGAAGDLAYIHRRDDEDFAAGEDGQAQDGKLAAAGADAKPVDVEARLMDTAAGAAMLELGREAEILLSAMRGERESLLGAISRLQNEYLLRGATEFAELRALLRELFDRGNRESDAIGRIIAQLDRQVGAFNAYAPELRDGMLAESLRELMKSADRRGGEIGAFSQAVDAVAKLLQEARQNGQPVPDAALVDETFARVHAEGMGRWLLQAERSDPMGRELAAAERAMAGKAVSVE